MLLAFSMKKLYIFFVLINFFASTSFSQTISVGDYAESLARMNQLLGTSNDASSFTQHPLNSAFNVKGDSLLQSMVAGKNLVPKIVSENITRLLGFTVAETLRNTTVMDQIFDALT